MKDRGFIVDVLLTVQHGKCAVCKEPLDKTRATYHHTLHNNKGNRHNYPLFIHSCCNGKAVCWKCIGSDNIFVTTDKDAMLYEKALKSVLELIENTEVEPYKLFKDIEIIWKRRLNA